MLILSVVAAALTAVMAYVYMAIPGPVLEGATVASASIPLYVICAGAIMAITTFLSRNIYAFLKLFIIGYAVASILFYAATIWFAVGSVPEWAQSLRPAGAMTLAFSIYAFVVYLLPRIPVVRECLDLSESYFTSRDNTLVKGFSSTPATEGFVGRAFFLAIIAVNFFQTYLLILLNSNYGQMFDSFEQKNAGSFWSSISVWFVLAAIWVVVAISEYLFRQYMLVRWRRHLSRELMTKWFSGSNQYRMQLSGTDADNPDQRIAEDARNYTYQLETISNAIFSTFLTLAAFIVLLWNLSGQMKAPSDSALASLTSIPGYLVWICLAYAAFGTIIGHIIGRKLVDRNIKKEKTEADFRFSLVRVREYAEQIALIEGNEAEKQSLFTRYENLVKAVYSYVTVYRNFTTFRFSLDQLSDRFSYILVAPAYFAGVGSLGIMQQIASAFGRVQNGFSIILNLYDTLATFKAAVNRINGFVGAADAAQNLRAAGPVIAAGEKRGISIENVTLELPDGRKLLGIKDLHLHPGDVALVTGPSGSGKSTLFRAIAGIWPFGKGKIEVPQGKTVMLLPQKPYIPIGSLRAALAYPASITAVPESEMIAAMEKVGLSHLVPRLDEDVLWAQALSGGEQQRVAIVRALLKKPDWLFLDEATAALDETMEAKVYAVLKEILPQTTIVSIGHRKTLLNFHNRRIDMKSNDDGTFTPVDFGKTVPAE